MGNTTDKTIQTIDQIKNKVVDFLTDYGFQIIGAVIILTIGLIIAWWIGRVLREWLEKKQVEPPIVMLAVRVARLLVFLVALLDALEKLSVPIAPALGVMGVAGVGIGFALQGVLGNLVAGLVIIFSKPFRVGEYIEVAGVSGQVKHIELFSTMLLHADRSHVMIPNRKLVGEIMHNYGQIRQLDLGVGVGYGTSMDGALKIVREILAANPRVLKEPVPFIGIAALGDFSIQITIKPWTKVPDYNPAQVEIYEAILNQFRANKIEIPFPQREVRLINQN
ncbi:MAG TPA: mechanosensitive ion channel domain-containing protein [Verrucomicrobiae bacterium]|jgi:small conductance mechanosensitive channel|nr:mechanosensitive ion channel domain-containing protein [Verrucomicrobiae bacterium]